MKALQIADRKLQIENKSESWFSKVCILQSEI